MAALNFPDPSFTQTYTEAGITWTWNATLGVWSAEPAEGFSGDYNDLINRPNIPEDFDLEDGSEVNNLIVWRSAGEVVELTLDPDAADQLNQPNAVITYTEMPTQTDGSGTGLTINYTAEQQTGIREFHIGFPGSGYEVGDRIDVFDADGGDRGFGGTITNTSSTVGSHPGPDGESGWYPEEGEDYYVSTRKDSTVTASPRFLGNTVFGTRPNGETILESGKLNFYGIGARGNPEFSYVGGSENSVFHHRYYRSPDTDSTATALFSMYGDRLANGDHGNVKTQVNIGNNVSVDLSDTQVLKVRRLNATSTYIEIDPQLSKITSNRVNNALDISSHNGTYNFKDSTGNNRGIIRAGAVTSDDSGSLVKVSGLEFSNSRSIKATSSNNAMAFSSDNAKFNFNKTNGNVGWQIDAGAGTAVPKMGYVLEADSENPANYDAEGEYTGPVQDLVSVIETLKQQKADLLASVSDLVTRVEALEGGGATKTTTRKRKS